MGCAVAAGVLMASASSYDGGSDWVATSYGGGSETMLDKEQRSNMIA